MSASTYSASLAVKTDTIDSDYTKTVDLTITFPSDIRTITANQYKGTSGTTAMAGTIDFYETDAYSTKSSASITNNGGTSSIANSTTRYVKITAPIGYTVYSVDGANWSKDDTNSTTTVWKGTISASSNQTLTVRYAEDKKGVEVDVNTNGTRGTTGGNITISGSTGATTGSNTINVGIETSATLVKATENAGYSFTGWTISGSNYSHLRYSFNGSTWSIPTSNGMSIPATNTTLYIKTDGNSSVSTATAVVTANFNSVYYLSAFDSYECPDGEHVKFITSPPRLITVTHGGTTYTYTYDGTMTKGNPDTGSDPEHSGTTTSNPDGIIAIGNNSYGAGNYIQVYGGDTVTLTYSSMASSEMIRGVFFNNDIQYRTVAPTAEQYVQHDYNPARTLYANSTYYDGETATYIASQTYPLSDSNIDQSAHTVSFTATGNVKNIDIEIAAKRKVFFSDTTNAVIQSKNTEDYYYNGEALSGSTAAKYLTVKAAGSSVGQTNTIDKSNIHIYEADENGVSTGVDITSSFTLTYSTGSSAITNSGGTSASSAYIKIDGTMPNNNIYIDLGVTSSFAIKLGSKIMNDFAGTWTRLASPADVTLTGGSSNLTASTDSDLTSGSSTITAGSSVTLKTVWKFGYANFFTFIGWYLDDGKGAPDFENGFLSDKMTLSYTPRSNKNVWAVGTRELYINGNAGITGKSGTNFDTANNLPMSYDVEKDKFYWEIDADMFAATGTTPKLKATVNESTWINDGRSTAMSATSPNADNNGWFQIYNQANGEDSNRSESVWNKIDFITKTSFTDGGDWGKAKWGGDATDKLDGLGYINFQAASGYDAPIRIYVWTEDNNTTFKMSVEPSFTYSSLYVSNGFTVGSTLRTSRTTVQPVYNGNVVTSGQTGYFSVGEQLKHWAPDIEGDVYWYKPAKKGGTVRITKTTGGSDKVEGFLIYDVKNKTVRTERNVKNSGSNYYIDLKLADVEQKLYICPIIEEAGANVTITFDATQLNRTQWGDIVTAFAWYQSGTGEVRNAFGGYPGQPMICSDDMNTWTAKFKSTNSLSAELEGITFSNYVDSNHSWLGCTKFSDNSTTDAKVMSSVTYGGSGTQASPTTVAIASDGIIKQYNNVESGNNKEFSRANFKAQTYDYREPIAMYERMFAGGATEFNISFSMKDGNSNLLSWKHTDMMYVQPSSGSGTGGAFVKADGTTPQNIITTSWGPLNFEPLTNAKGDKYVDMNGNNIVGKPTPSFYVAAKGGVIYGDSELKTVFHTGNTGRCFQQPGVDTDDKNTKDLRWTTAAADKVTYGGASGVNLNYAVEWYVYDAAGNYITTVLSAGIADSAAGDNSTSYIAKQLKDQGYAVDGKAVSICYDKPRYMYWDDENITDGAQAYPDQYVNSKLKRINSGTGFGVYRFTGQWHAASNTDTVKVNVKVGIMTASGEVLAESNKAAYGNAKAEYDKNKGNYAKYGSVTNDDGYVIKTGSNGEYVQTAVGDAENNPIKLTADSENFVGWYYYDSNTGKFTKANYEDPTDFYPSFANKDVTFYAMYRAAAFYSYKYQGREGDQYYSVSGGDLTEDELADNKIRYGSGTERTTTGGSGAGAYDVKNLAPGDTKVEVFKRTIDFSSLSTYEATRDYILDVSTATASVAQYQVTYYYPDTKAASLAAMTMNVHTTPKTNYDTTIDLSSANASANAPTGTVFMGWYEYDPTKSGDARYGQLLTTQGNYGFVITKDITIGARYGSAAATGSGWNAFIDENKVTKEMDNAQSGRYYNDTIVRFRNGVNASEKVPEGAEVGVIILNDGKTNGNITPSNNSKLVTYANALTNNQTAKIGSEGKTVTKLCKTIGADGDPLSYYNRFDFALRSDYKATVGSKYNVYAYVKISGTYYWSVVSSGTYTAVGS